MTEARVPDLSEVSSPPRRELTYRDFEIVERIGRGGEAVVSKASIEGTGPPTEVAIKEPRAAETLTTDTVEEFLAEAERWQTVDSREREKPRWADDEHVVSVIDTGDRRPWIALEYMDGGCLAERLETASSGLSPREALWVGECVCRGVAVAHGCGIAHLDLKPANVLFRETPGDRWDVPKVADWGLSRVLSEQSGVVDGLSVAYAAPEQFEPAEFGDPDTLTDIYQIGALLYAMLTGEPPYTGSGLSVQEAVVEGETPPPPSTRRSDVSAATDAAVLHALDRDKTERYRSVENFGDALRAIRTGDRPSRVVPGLSAEGTSAEGRDSGARPASTAVRGESAARDTGIAVVGCGSSGTNTINRLAKIGVEGAETVAIDADEQHLEKIVADSKVLVGESIVQGEGVGGDPSVGARAAERARETLGRRLADTDLVVVTAGMGGGTGTGAAPVVSRIASDRGATVLAAVSTPLDADTDVVEEGIERLRSEADSVAVLDYDRLVEHMPDLSAGEAFSVMDQLVAQTLKGLVETVTQPSFVDLDVSDVLAVLTDIDVGTILVGETRTGDATDAVADAVAHPLFDVDYRMASEGLVHVTGGPDLSLDDAERLVDAAVDRVDPDGQVPWGATRRTSYEGKVRICVLLSGVEIDAT
jgi:cell division protein FtsZ